MSGLRNHAGWFRIPLLALSLAAANICLPATGSVLSALPLPVRSLDHAGWAVADFDGDSQPDVAITRMAASGSGYVYWLEFDLSTKHDGGSATGPDLPAIASSKFGLHLTPRDVDGDHDLDIVVTMGIARLPVAVWINDGQGRFAEGDLAAYPALTCLDPVSLSAQSNADMRPVVYDQGRRSLFGLMVRGLSQTIPPLEVRPASQPELLIPRFHADQSLARAPPVVL